MKRTTSASAIQTPALALHTQRFRTAPERLDSRIDRWLWAFTVFAHDDHEIEWAGALALQLRDQPLPSEGWMAKIVRGELGQATWSALQADARALLAAKAAALDGAMTFTAPPFTVGPLDIEARPWRQAQVGHSPHVVATVSGSLDRYVRFGIVLALAADGSRDRPHLRRCKAVDCQRGFDGARRWFVASHKTEFCSSTCKARVNQRDFREAEAERELARLTAIRGGAKKR
jgi:hypothetical protein